MTRPRHWLAILIVAGAIGIAAAQEPAHARPRMLVGTKDVVEEPALPTYLTIMPRVVAEATAQMPPTIDEAIAAAYVAAAARSTDNLPQPATIPDSVRESYPSPTYIVMPSSTVNPPDEVGAAMLRQTVAVLGAIVVAWFVVVVACVLFVRRRAAALFRVQVVGDSPSSSASLPTAVAEPNRSTYVAPIANFVIGPTFGEEVSKRQAKAERRSHAVFSQIAADNLMLRAELSRQLQSTEPAVGILARSTAPECRHGSQ